MSTEICSSSYPNVSLSELWTECHQNIHCFGVGARAWRARRRARRARRFFPAKCPAAIYALIKASSSMSFPRTKEDLGEFLSTWYNKGTLCTSLFDFTYWAPFSFQNSNVFVQTDFFLVVKNAVWIFEKSPNFFENFKNPWKIIEEYLFTRIWWWSRFSKILTLKFSPLQWKFWKFLKKFQNGPKNFFRTVN